MRGSNLFSTKLVASGFALAFAAVASAGDMEPMSDAEMSAVNGQGVGIVMEDFRFAHEHDPANGKTFKLTGITNEAGEDVQVLVDHLYIGGTGSDFGNNLQTVNLGRLTNPFSMNLRDGGTISSTLTGKAVFELAAPSKVASGSGVACIPGGSNTTCSSRAPDSTQGIRGERMDIGFASTVQSGSADPQKLNIHAESAVVDGSYIRLWGAGPGDSRQQLRGQIQSNFYADRLSINACDQTGASCGDSIAFNDFMMELAIGNEHQPLFLSVLGPSHEVVAERGNLRVELRTITDARSPAPINDSGTGSSDGDATYQFYEDYYTNEDYRSSISAGDVQIGGESLGSARIKGMLFQKLETTTRSLD